MRLRYQHTRLSTDATPFFAGRTNVSGDAGIGGNNQEPVNWGPPTLVFCSGLAGLGHPQFSAVDDLDAWRAAPMSLWSRGRHNLTFGGGMRHRQLDVLGSRIREAPSRSLARRPGRTSPTSCSASRTRARSRSATPTSTCVDRFSTPTSTTTGGSRPTLTVNLGVRWEYESPLTESRGRLVNLDVAPGFTAAAAGGRGRSGRRCDRRPIPELAAAARSTGSAATARPRLAPDRRVVAGRARRLRHLPQHRRVSVDRAAAGAAAAAVDDR